MKKVIEYILENIFQFLAIILLSVVIVFFSPISSLIQTIIVFVSFGLFLKLSYLFITSTMDYFDKDTKSSPELIPFGFFGAIFFLAIIIFFMTFGDFSRSGNCDYEFSRSGLTCG